MRDVFTVFVIVMLLELLKLLIGSAAALTVAWVIMLLVWVIDRSREAGGAEDPPAR